MRSILKYSAVALTVLSLAAQSASAQFVQQTTRPVGTTTVWSGANGSTYTVGNVSATAASGTFTSYVTGPEWTGGFASGDQVLFASGNPAVTFTFANAIYGFGTQAWNNPCCGTTFSLAAYFQGNLVGSFNQASGGGSAGGNNNQASLFAFTSTQAVDQVVLSSSEEFGVNQLDTDGMSPIVTPEPTSAAMLAGALAALGFVVRRRQNKRTI